jgi:hypothetical protein
LCAATVLKTNSGPPGFKLRRLHQLHPDCNRGNRTNDQMQVYTDTAAPVNVRVVYIRDDGTKMVEVAPHEAVNPHTAAILRLLPCLAETREAA